MTTITPVWLTPEAHDRLIRELAVLRGWGGAVGGRGRRQC